MITNYTTTNQIPTREHPTERIKTNSWFNISELRKEPQSQIPNKICIAQENQTATKKIKLYPNKQQRDYLQKWMELSRQMYNKIVLFLNNEIFDEENKPIKDKVKQYVKYNKLRDEYLSNEKSELTKDKISTLVLNEMFRHCVAKNIRRVV